MELPPIVDAGWVLAHRDEVVLADVRWYLDGRSGRDAFTAAHVPGATFVDLEHDLSTPGDPTDGRHPLPSPEELAAALGRLGIGEDDVVIAYDDSGGGTAGRLVWMLRVIGHPAALLDGGLRAWPEPPESGDGAVPTAHDGPAPALARRSLRRPRRDRDRGRGPGGRRARRRGRRPASPARTARSTGGPGTSRAPATRRGPATSTRRRVASATPPALRQRFADLGVGEDTEVICYCGSGVSACADLLALERAGVGRTRLYVPSWSGWSADPARPAAQGRE